MNHGLVFLVGSPGSGKTHKALELARAIGKPTLAIDSARMIPPAAAPGVGSRDAALVQVYQVGGSCRWTPRTEAEFDSIFAAVERVGKRRPITVLVDELVFWTSSGYSPDHFLYCCRVQRDLELHLLVTTQQPQDLPGKIRNCASEVYGFKTVDRLALEGLRSWFNVDRVRALDITRHEFLRWSILDPGPATTPPAPPPVGVYPNP